MKKQEKGCRGKGGGIICPLLQKFLRAPVLLVAKLKDGFCCRSRFRLQLAMYRGVEWLGLPAALLNCNTVETFQKEFDCYFKNPGYL